PPSAGVSGSGAGAPSQRGGRGRPRTLATPPGAVAPAAPHGRRAARERGGQPEAVWAPPARARRGVDRDAPGFPPGCARAIAPGIGPRPPPTAHPAAGGLGEPGPLGHGSPGGRAPAVAPPVPAGEDTSNDLR